MENRKCCFFFAGYYTVAAAAETLSRYHITNRIVKAATQVKNSCQFAVMVTAGDAEMAKYIFEREETRINKMIYMDSAILL